MSITVAYFFNSEMSLPQLAESVNGCLGCSFAPYKGDEQDMFCRLLSIELDLCRHDLVNDCALDFENYQYELGTRTAVPDGDLRQIQVELVAMITFILYRRLNIDRGMLVFEVQTLLARYRAHNGNWFDEVSGQAVIFPQHFIDLHERISREGWRQMKIAKRRRPRKGALTTQ